MKRKPEIQVMSRLEAYKYCKSCHNTPAVIISISTPHIEYPYEIFKSEPQKGSFTVLFAFTAFGSHAFAQTVTANGKVIDVNGEPLIGVGVLVTGTTAGTVTDLDGNFSIPVASGATLEFSSIGYATQSVVVTNSNPMTITLAEDNEALEEAVVVGYGTQKKGLVTGSVVTVNSDEIQKQATTNVLSSLYSTTPGVNITRTSGMSWGTPKITIRGLNTTGDSSPLYVIDGIAGGSIEHLNSSDIESISILKDALRLLKKHLKKLRHMKISYLSIDLVIAKGNAADTAIEYGKTDAHATERGRFKRYNGK